MIDKKIKRCAKQLERKLSQRKWKNFLREYYLRLRKADIREKEVLEEFFEQTVLIVTKKKPSLLSPDLKDIANRYR